MKNSVKNNGTKKVVNNVVVTDKAILNAVTKKVNSYKVDVLEANANFKTALRTTNKAIKLLIASEVLNSKQIAICKTILKDDETYKKFDSTVRRTPNNMVTPFYVLQSLYRISKKY